MVIENDKVEAIIVLPRELFYTTDISVTLWILNQNKKGGMWHDRKQRNRSGEILFMDLRQWTDNAVKGEQKKKVELKADQVERARDIYFKWQAEGTDGANYAEPELYRSVSLKELKENGYSLVPSRYIEFVDAFPMNAAGKILKYKMRENAVVKYGLQKADAVVTA